MSDKPVIQNLPPVPDFLGKDTRVVAVSDVLAEAQRQRLQYSQMMLVNDHQETDEIPQPTVPGMDPPKPILYGERLRELDEGMRRLVEDNEDIRDELEEEAHARRMKAKAARTAAA